MRKRAPLVETVRASMVARCATDARMRPMFDDYRRVNAGAQPDQFVDMLIRTNASVFREALRSGWRQLVRVIK